MSEVCVELVGKLVGEMLGLSKEELSPSDNLISLGLGSLDIMRIAGLLTKNGCNVTFSELVSNPCMASWVNFARERSARSSSNGSPGVRTVTWTAAYAASPNRLLRLSIVS